MSRSRAASSPFGATVELLRGVVRRLGVPEVRRLLGRDAAALAPLLPVLGRAEDDHVDRAAVFGAVLGLLEALDRPVAWLVDDLQWMDSQSKDLVSYLSRVLAGPSVLLLATVRTDHGSPAGLPDDLAHVAKAGQVITLARLNTSEVADQVRAIAGGELDRDEVERICEVSDGLPFFVEQLVASGGRAEGSLRQVVLAGVGELSREARTLLAAAAVGDGLLVPALLREVSGLGPTFDGALAEVRAADLLGSGTAGTSCASGTPSSARGSTRTCWPANGWTCTARGRGRSRS